MQAELESRTRIACFSQSEPLYNSNSNLVAKGAGRLNAMRFSALRSLLKTVAGILLALLPADAGGWAAARSPDIVIFLTDDQGQLLKALRAELEAWMREQGDQRMIFHEPRLLDDGLAPAPPALESLQPARP